MAFGQGQTSIPATSAVLPGATETQNFAQQPQVQANEEIYIPISDEDLIERIYIEKYEPRGMTRRSFFKSHDLQVRELEKEKQRIRDNIRAGMSMEDACKSEKQRELDSSSSTSTTTTTTNTSTTVVENRVDDITKILGFDPTAPIEIVETVEKKEKKSEKRIVTDENGNQKLEYDELTEEEEVLDNANREYDKLIKESVILKQKTEKAASEIQKVAADIASLRDTIDKMHAEIRASQDEITDLEVKISSSKGKEKERLSKEMIMIEDRIRDRKAKITSNESSIVEKENIQRKLDSVLLDFEEKASENSRVLSKSEENLRIAEAKAKEAQERAKRAKQQEQFDKQANYLSPIFESVARCDLFIRSANGKIEKRNEEKVALKSELSSLQTQLLSATDPAVISSMSEAIKEKNKQISEIDKFIATTTKARADKNIELSGYKKKAVDYIERENITVDNVIKMEDSIISRVTLEQMCADAETDQREAELNLLDCQSRHAELIAEFGSSAEKIASETAEKVKVAEDEITLLQMELDDLDQRVPTMSDDDEEKLNAMLRQQELPELIADKNNECEQLRASGIKSNLEYKLKYETEIRAAAEKLEKAQADYDSATERIASLAANAGSSDHITSGSGLIAQDRQAIEAQNAKKQLEESQSAIEQAKLQAKIAQLEAERAIIDAERASAASKAEAEKLAKEAIEKAEIARKEAEAKAAEEAEKARLEAERAKQEIDKVKQEAAEEAERLKNEAERMKREAESEAERIKREAEEAKIQAEEAKNLAEEELNKAKLKAEEDARRESEEAEERARKEAEMAAEKARMEAEQEMARAKQKAEEEARLQAAEEAKRAEEAATQARIAEKVTKRKQEIADLRSGLKAISSEDEGVELKEKFFALSLALDEEEKAQGELTELIDRSMTDALHAGEVAKYKAAAAASANNVVSNNTSTKNKKVTTKVTERVNMIPRSSLTGGANASSGARAAGARPAGARPAGARPAGARPAGAAGARPAGARPTGAAGARPAGARPTGAAGARPAGARPTGAAGARPAGARPAGAAGARPAGARPTGAAGARPSGAKPAGSKTSRPPQ